MSSARTPQSCSSDSACRNRGEERRGEERRGEDRIGYDMI